MISRSRFNVALQEMTSAAQKVFAAVPEHEFWPIPKIAAEMKRQGINADIAHVAGCLHSMLHTGMVREQLRGHFCKAEIREPAPKQPPKLVEVKKEAMKPAPITVKKTPLEILGDLSSRAIVLSDMVKKYASDVESAAIEIQQQIETGDEETAKLRQLQSLLKSLG